MLEVDELGEGLAPEDCLSLVGIAVPSEGDPIALHPLNAVDDVVPLVRSPEDDVSWDDRAFAEGSEVQRVLPTVDQGEHAPPLCPNADGLPLGYLL